MNGKIYGIAKDLFDKYGEFPGVEAVRGHPDVMSETMPEQHKINNQITICVESRTNFTLQDIRDNMSNWMQAMIAREGIHEANVFFNGGKFVDLVVYWKKIGFDLVNATFDDMGRSYFSDYAKDFQDEMAGRDGALTTGLPIFDQALMEGATNGGLQRGDMTLFLAPVNVGKTTTLITIAVANVRQNRSILMMTHEGRHKDIKTKIWQCMMGRTKAELFAMYSDPKERRRLHSMQQFLDQYLVYIPINQAGMDVEYVEGVIRRAQEERIAKTGAGYDMLISDYPAKLTTKRAAKGNLPRREIDRIVYDYYVQMGLEHNFHVLTAIQTNREGSKVNRGLKEDRLLSIEDVSEAWGPMEMATSVVSINRSPKAMANGRVTFFVCKSRGSETGKAIVCKSNYAKAITHSSTLGCTWYRGEATIDDQIDDLLAQYHNVAIPEHLNIGGS